MISQVKVKTTLVSLWTTKQTHRDIKSKHAQKRRDKRVLCKGNILNTKTRFPIRQE